MDQKMQFIADYLRGELSMTELCEMYGIARKTGYKFITRYLSAGPEALEERSREPHNHPNQTPEDIVQAILEMRRRHPSWGAKKLLPLLEKRHPRWDLPSRTERDHDNRWYRGHAI
jgi:transposase